VEPAVQCNNTAGGGYKPTGLVSAASSAAGLIASQQRVSADMWQLLEQQQQRSLDACLHILQACAAVFLARAVVAV
jgi:hypothetical protein